MMGRIKVGVTSWAGQSLIDAGFYPPHARSPEARLRSYASQFPLVENDMTYYAVPEPAMTEAWSRRTPPGFTMNVKAFALFTGHYTDPRRLPPDLRAGLPAELRARPRIYPRDVGGELLAELGRRFREALVPLAASGRLGVVLFQYPVWFPFCRENLDELRGLGAKMAPYRVAVELRNATWMTERHRVRTLDTLADGGLLYTCVDEPQGFPSSVPPIVAATGPIALVRLHGRNANRWSRAARSAAERFDYLYSPEELAEWAPRILALAGRAPEVHVLFNNCHADYAVRNARQMTELLARPAAAEPAPAPIG